VGKTLIAVALVRALDAAGFRARGLKPLASGAERTSERPRNGDALALQAEGRPRAAYALVNPFCFEPAIAPHLAAAGRRVPTRLQACLTGTEGQPRTAPRGHRRRRRMACPAAPGGYTSDLPVEGSGLPASSSGCGSGA
jgi:dethiobiotin synthetase